MHSRIKHAVILIMPPQKGLLAGFATGLFCLASHLEYHNSDTFTEILNLSSSNPAEVERALRNLRQRIAGLHPIIGITTTTASYQEPVRKPAEQALERVCG